MNRRTARIGAFLLSFSLITSCGLADRVKSKINNTDLSTAPNLSTPTISSIANQSLIEGASNPIINLTVSDVQTPAENLALTATSDNPSLISTSGLTFGGTGANRTLTLTPIPGKAGIATIKVAVDDGSRSAETSFTFTVIPVTKLEVPIEMLMAGISSKTSAQTFHSTRTSLDTSDYDGSVRYFFEITATNGNLSAFPVELINTSNTSVASISVPSLSLSATRRRIEFTPTPGANTYRIKLPATLTGNALKVYLARIIVQQTGATKTKVFVPLLSSNANTITNNDKIVGVHFTNGIYQPATQSSRVLWGKNASNWSTLAATAPYTLEAVVYNNHTAGVSNLALYDKTANLMVTDSEVIASGVSNPTLFTKSFSDSSQNLTDLHDFEIRAQDDNSNLRVARAGLWIKLDALYKGEVYYIASRSFSADGITGNQRALIDTTLFSNPFVMFEASGYRESLSSHFAELRDHGTNDSVSGGSTPISDSSLTFSADGNAGDLSRVRSAALSGITSGNRFLVQNTNDGVTTLGLVVVGFEH